MMMAVEAVAAEDAGVSMTEVVAEEVEEEVDELKEDMSN